MIKFSDLVFRPHHIWNRAVACLSDGRSVSITTHTDPRYKEMLPGFYAQIIEGNEDEVCGLSEAELVDYLNELGAA